MSFDRDDPDGESDGMELSTCTVEAEGCYGSASWVVGKQLYDLLPRDKRDGLLKMTGDRKIGPFFEGTCERLLRQAGCATDVHALSTDWSLQSRDIQCSFGQVTWLMGEGFWEGMPEDQRDTLLDAADALIHDYFHEVQARLMMYAFRKLNG